MPCSADLYAACAAVSAHSTIIHIRSSYHGYAANSHKNETTVSQGLWLQVHVYRALAGVRSLTLTLVCKALQVVCTTAAQAAEPPGMLQGYDNWRSKGASTLNALWSNISCDHSSCGSKALWHAIGVPVTKARISYLCAIWAEPCAAAALAASKTLQLATGLQKRLKPRA